MPDDLIRLNLKVWKDDDPVLYDLLKPINKRKRCEEIRHLVKLGLSVKHASNFEINASINQNSVITTEAKPISENVKNLTDNIDLDNDAHVGESDKKSLLTLQIPETGSGDFFN